MKSYLRTIIVLGVIALLMITSALAQEIPGENATAGIENLPPAAAAPSPSKEKELVPLPSLGTQMVDSPTAKENTPADALPPPPPLPPPSGVATVIPAAGEVDTATGVELKINPTIVENAEAMSVAIEPSRRAYTYVMAPSATNRSSSSSRKVLVIPNTEIKAEDLAVITQDLQVMAHIFHKIFTGPRLTEGIFMDYGDFFGRGSRATEAVYLQGYGVLFLMEVNIPLSSPPKAKEQEKDDNTQKADSVWQQAQQEVFQPSPYRKTRTIDPTERYDAEKVEELKSRLIKALKHAANMKNLEPDEMIILTVIGKGPSYPGDVYSYGREGGGGYSSYSRSSGMSGLKSGAAREATKTYSGISRDPFSATRSTRGGTGGASSTVLTIRAKKSDIDAFAKGDLDYDKFREKVQILTYPSLGQQVVRRYRIRRPGRQPEELGALR